MRARRANDDWLASFLDCDVQHLLRTRSYHLPLLLSTKSTVTQPRMNRSFKLLAAWMEHPIYVSSFSGAMLGVYSRG